MPQPFNLDDVKLLAEDENKPADLKTDPEPVVDPPADPVADPAAPVVPPVESPAPEVKPADEEIKPPAEEPKPEAPPVVPAPAADLTPFHEHPDWKKMQEQVRLAEERATRAEQQSRAKAAPDEFANMTKAQIIEKIVTDKTATGWKPKDQLDYDITMQDARDRADEAIKAQSEKTANLARDTFVQIGITDPADQRKVADLLTSWASAGMNVTLATFGIAAEHLKLKGELGIKPVVASAPVAPVVTPAAPAPTAQRDKTNSRISRSKSSGGDPKSAGPSFEYLRNNSLDTIILDQASKV